MKIITTIASIGMMGIAPGALWVDFNSEQSGGGLPTPGDPTSLTGTDGTNGTVHLASGYQNYHARHEVPGDFVTATYNPSFRNSGPAVVTLTPTWPNTTDARVQQSISRGDGFNANYTNPGLFSLDLVRDWIGVDTRVGGGGNGNFDGTTGTPTFIDLTLGGLPADLYQWTSIHHDTEHTFGNFNVYVNTGSGFELAGSGFQADSSPLGNPDSGVLRIEGPANAFTTTFAADGTSDVVLRFEPLSGQLGDAVHNQFFAINGFQLDQVPEPSSALLAFFGVILGFRRRR